jgi:hypothetical protein
MTSNLFRRGIVTEGYTSEKASEKPLKGQVIALCIGEYVF